MPSPESTTFNAAPATNGELAGETPRQTYEIRGETTLKAEHEQRERELLEERARIIDRLQVLNAEIAGHPKYIRARPESCDPRRIRGARKLSGRNGNASCPGDSRKSNRLRNCEDTTYPY